jgi:tRNA threonylcarbamoyladenosine biosynthesis protein TsaB
MITLAIDASTYAGDAAVLDGSRVLAEETVAMKGADCERLMPAIASVLEQAKLGVGAVDRVVCGGGPGSFTSLRIAGGIAKGIATGRGCPLYAVPSMALLIGGATLKAGRYLAAIDALRFEFYVALYDVGDAADGARVTEIEPARLVPADQVERVASEHAVKIVSPSPFSDSVVASPRARGVACVEELLLALGPVDVGGWEPSYGRLAEAQVRWEAAHGKPLSAG